MGKLLFLSIFLSSAAFTAEEVGMPQLDTEFWLSQIFWLTITFSILFLLLSKLILPKISANLETRKSLILENISTAEKKREESELKIKEYNEIIEKSKNEAKNLVNQAKEKLTKDINKKKEALEKDLSNEIQKAEMEIQEFRDKAPERVNKIAIQVSTDLLQQLISTNVNSSSISTIVNDLSSKKMDKYYGN
jgi:F-type H+-transporting ATPase subunit b|tara:strand:- start:175 stop:750 length:576 start_codon:yes stop_codon:yes gene_type:complete